MGGTGRSEREVRGNELKRVIWNPLDCATGGHCFVMFSWRGSGIEVCSHYLRDRVLSRPYACHVRISTYLLAIVLMTSVCMPKQHRGQVPSP